MSVEDLRPDWCPPLPAPGSIDPYSGRLFCPWCDEGHQIDEDADLDDLDGCPGCGRAIHVSGSVDDEDEGIVLAIRTDADIRYLHWRAHRIENATLGIPAPDPLLYRRPTENDR